MRFIDVRGFSAVLVCLAVSGALADEAKKPIDGTGPGWRELTKDDFVNVNCGPDTWQWKDGLLYCTGQPVGVLRTAKEYQNFEMVV